MFCKSVVVFGTIFITIFACDKVCSEAVPKGEFVSDFVEAHGLTSVAIILPKDAQRILEKAKFLHIYMANKYKYFYSTLRLFFNYVINKYF